jgi:hypothetical protein
MSALDHLFNRSPREKGVERDSRGSDSGEDPLPFPGYDRLEGKAIAARLWEFSQIELGEVETYERSHRARPAVLNKLRYMRTPEPLPGYDALASEQIAEALADADTETVTAVRTYERKFRRRPRVLEEVERVRPLSTPSAREDRLRAENAERVRAGVAGRAQAADRLTGRHGQTAAKGD